MKRQLTCAVPEWVQPGPSQIWATARDEIIRYRRLMLVHSCIYYKLDDSLVSDHKWQEWADYLAWLQMAYGWQAGFYDQYFEDWDGSTGYHLPHELVMHVALRLVKEEERQRQQGLF